MQQYRYSSPLGTLRLEANSKALVGLYFEDAATSPDQAGATGLLAQAVEQLDAYFAGQRKTFDLPLEMQGTDFQKAVWAGLLQIPYGQTWSYAQLAEHVGRPKAVRAVGLSNGRNPISILVPCHRVIGKNGSLTGYGGGLEKKRRLLQLEQTF